MDYLITLCIADKNCHILSAHNTKHNQIGVDKHISNLLYPIPGFCLLGGNALLISKKMTPISLGTLFSFKCSSQKEHLKKNGLWYQAASKHNIKRFTKEHLLTWTENDLDNKYG